MVDRSRLIKYTDEQVIQCYRELKSPTKAAKCLGIGATTVERILMRNKVQRDGRQYYLKNAKAYSDEVELQIVKEYTQGIITADLIKKYGGSNHSLDRVLSRHGVEKRPDPSPGLTDDELEKIKELHALGFGQARISVEIGRSQTFVSQVMKRHGILAHRRMGWTHGSWKGGRAYSGAYIAVFVDRNDPFFAMARSDNRVMEHRLVMARHLGRILDESETVHHINGNPTDNRIENLQLRQGRHGKGAVAYCIECGSHNIGHKPLPEQAQ